MNDGEIRAAYRSHASPSTIRTLESLSARVATGANGATVQTSDGQSLIDLASGGFGYGHPDVCAKVAEQMRSLPLSCRTFFSRPLALLVERIAALAPGELEVSYPCHSSTEAIEGALKLARGYHPSRRKVVATVGACHGTTLGALSVCGIESIRNAFRKLPIKAEFVEYGNCAAIASAIDAGTAAVIIEPIASGGGVKLPPMGYMRVVSARCSATGSLFIADESITSLGRTGKRFAIDFEKVIPDVLIIGETLGGGVLPCAAYVTTRKINSRVYGRSHPALHGSTTGGNPAACAAALATLNALETDKLAERACWLGSQLLSRLQSYVDRYGDSILEHSGCGLMASLRIRDEPTAKMIRQSAYARGVLIRLERVTNGQVWIGMRPPLIISAAELERGLMVLGEALDEILASSTARVGASL